ncbi:acetyltransferase [Reichenbachiella agariperforans]|uniref:Sugar O-acyltransferase, sialic acid O-acetyltransferase NeuD family n=1 Tax=Reichenbachiella agariperforans TaxID=156994 RepID=A0A1M6NDL4_REIAG|nr:acetyltransferase [Reichenbachiella agariperforans]MBU2915838.1 acetyltransferase [Reichenbachiella agariperforans]SHJ93780.1 sugar O-acyltransferase, sialic acid O-acetyltransferase NeuD family [Reichenbachiella agariperforans]
MDNPVIIFGAGGLGRAALEIFESNGNVIYGFLDDNKSLHNTEIDNVPVLGETSDDGFLKLIGKKCEAFVATDDNKEKKSFAKVLIDKRKKMPVNAIHNSVVMSRSCEIGHGNFVNSGSKLGAGVQIGSHCLINSGATIDHSAKLGDFVQVGAGSVIGAGVEIADEVFIGSGAVIVSGVKLGKGARIGAGSVVIAEVPAKQTVFGNPAVEVKK